MAKLRILSFLPYVLVYGTLCWVKLFQNDPLKAEFATFKIVKALGLISFVMAFGLVGMYFDILVEEGELNDALFFPLFASVLAYEFLCANEDKRLWFGVEIYSAMPEPIFVAPWVAQLSVLAWVGAICWPITSLFFT